MSLGNTKPHNVSDSNEDVTWSALHGGGWSKMNRIMRRRVGAELAPSSTMKNAPCHIPLTDNRIIKRRMHQPFLSGFV